MMNVEQSAECELAGETKILGENLPQCHFGHHKSQMTWPGLEPWANNITHSVIYKPSWEVDNSLSCSTQNIPSMYETRRLITVFRGPHDWAPSWASWMRSTSSHIIYWRDSVAGGRVFVIAFRASVNICWGRVSDPWVYPGQLKNEHRLNCIWSEGQVTKMS
jgi:hypothetical protein